MKYQPRFLAYAKFHKLSPEAVLERDRKLYPGGRMCGFMCWIQENVRAFRKASPASFVGLNIRDHKAFTKFLEEMGGHCSEN